MISTNLKKIYILETPKYYPDGSGDYSKKHRKVAYEESGRGPSMVLR